MNEKSTRTELYELGEFKLIDTITQNIKVQHKSTIKGVGDDAAVIDSKAQRIVITTDLLLEGIHFDLTYHPLKHLGYKAVAVNVSDIFAMNARPTQITVSLGLSKRFCLEDVQELYSGILLACERFGVDLVGGDTSASLTGLVISITAIGEASADNLCYRSGAKEKDLICVTGDLGAAYMGLQLLEREKKVLHGNTSVQPKFEGYDYILERFLKPEPRKQLIDMLDDAKILPSAMIDISDGLSSELLHICKNSRVGCRVYVEKIPIDQVTHKMAAEMNVDPVVAALNGGEDYELLFTAPIKHHAVLGSMQGVRIIGYVVPERAGAMLVTPQGSEMHITAQGWNAIVEE